MSPPKECRFDNISGNKALEFAVLVFPIFIRHVRPGLGIEKIIKTEEEGIFFQYRAVLNLGIFSSLRG